MNRVTSFRLCSGVATMLLSGCASYPIGLSRAQWEAIPLEKQAELTSQQYKLDETRRQQAAQRQIQAGQQAEAQARNTQQQVQSSYANAHYGDVVTMTLSAASMQNGRETYATEPVSFDLVRGEKKQIQIRGNAGRGSRIDTLNARFSDDGNSIYMNEDTFNNRRIVLTNNGWNHGTIQQLPQFKNEWGTLFTGMSASVRLKSFSGETPRLIIEQR